jgi:hypothetical protein
MDFTNPVLNADWPDPDASSSNRAPGLPVPQWQWQASPELGWFVLGGGGTLHLRVLPDDLGDVRLLPRVLSQPLPGRPSVWTTSLTFGPAEPGTRAGLVVIGEEYAWLGIEETPGGAHVVCRRSAGRGREHTLARETLPAREVEVRASCDAEGVIGFAWRTQGAWHEVGTRFPAGAGHWTGADVGLFATAPLGAPDGRAHVTFGAVSVDLVGVAEEAA